MLPSEILSLTTDPPVRMFRGVWKLLSFLRLPSWDGSPSLPLLSLFISFIFCPTSFQRHWAAFLGAWFPLPAFRSCLWNLLSVQMFFRWICGGESGISVLFPCHLRATPRIDAFKLWCWRHLRVPWTTKGSNQSILKEVSPEYSLEGPILKLKLQYLATWYEELSHLKRPWCWETLMAGGEGDDKGWYGWMTSLTWWTWVWASFGNWWQTGKPGMLQFMGSQKSDMTEWLNWMELKTNKQNWNLQKNIPYSESQWRNHNETIGGVQSQ